MRIMLCQICERDWQPSTVHARPANPARARRGEERDGVPDFFGAAKSPERKLCLYEISDPGRIGFLALVPGAPGKKNRSGRHAVHPNIVFRKLLRHCLRKADLGGLYRVVDHPPTRLSPPDRRNHDDDAAAVLPHVRHHEPRHPDSRIERLVERVLPFGVRRVDDVGAFCGSDVVHEDVDGAKARDGGIDDAGSAFGCG